MTTLDARNITVAFGGTPVLSDVAITARSGSFVGLIGPNGSGKSTLLRSLMGLQRLGKRAGFDRRRASCRSSHYRTRAAPLLFTRGNRSALAFVGGTVGRLGADTQSR